VWTSPGSSSPTTSSATWGWSRRCCSEPEAWALYQWAAALQICEGFTTSEQDLLTALHRPEMTRLLAHRSNQLLRDEEVKHIAMFKRFAAVLFQYGSIDALSRYLDTRIRLDDEEVAA
jgi:hypothetical protein